MLNTLKRFFLDQTESFLEKGPIFSHTDEMNNLTVNDKMYMTYDFFINHPMQAIELKLKTIIAKNPHLINSPNRSHIHPSIRKYSHINKDD